MPDEYDLVLVGSGPASAFFLHGFLEKTGPSARVLVLERGLARTHDWQLKQRPGGLIRDSRETWATDGEKRWQAAIAVGGGSNVWRGSTPRMLPEDFRLHSTYGVGTDWPIEYDDLEPHYCVAEQIMAVAGDSRRSPVPRSRPYPLPPHALTAPESRLAEATPDEFFSLPCARPSRAVGSRPRCCASGACSLCPIDSKFTVLNSMAAVFDDPRVELRTGATVHRLDSNASRVTAVHVLHEGREQSVEAEWIGLAANALFNAHILLASGLDDGTVGRGVYEPASVRLYLYLDGLDNYGGTTGASGHGYHLYGGEHRRDRAAVLLETWNAPARIRLEPGRWRQLMHVQAIMEDLANPASRVTLDPERPTRPRVVHTGYSEYMLRAKTRLKRDVAKAFAALPIERVTMAKRLRRSEGHILGTTPMGTDPKNSVTDRHLRHHSLRNLLVLGGGAFPTSGPANSTLTIAALSLWAAAKL